MSPTRPSALFVTDLTYQAKGRRYCDEDIFLSSRLREDFDLALCHPLDMVALLDRHAVVVIRNSGPVLGYRGQYDALRAHAAERGTAVHNPLTGKGDMLGKKHLVELTAQGFPVIPTVAPAEREHLPPASEYVVKPRLGADSIGLAVVPASQLSRAIPDDVVVQPRIEFRYEVSFYYVDQAFQYALYTPEPARRWDLQWYEPSREDLAFAQSFVDWNSMDAGIQRVDAGRTTRGELLLVELEDLNPYLSLQTLEEPLRNTVVENVKASIGRVMSQAQGG